MKRETEPHIEELLNIFSLGNLEVKFSINGSMYPASHPSSIYPSIPFFFDLEET